ncbi:MAG: TatD family hydrolase [Dehalococcoidia bacterium]|nr:TatD family hydrolase [Dehalococcoidia bacterium]
MTGELKIIDSHVHLDLIERHQPHRIQWLKENGCGVVSWAYFEGVDSVSRLESCLKAKAHCIRNHSSKGLMCHYLIGIHPRSIPPDIKPEHIGLILEPYLEDPLCRGIGEIGLETGDAREQEMFIAQLEIGKTLLKQGRVIGVHTPRSNKQAITEITLSILEDFAEISSSLVIDHCTPETIVSVLDAGFWAGVTLSPVKSSWEEMKGIASICSDRLDRIMCNTDSGGKFYEDVVSCRLSDDLPDGICKKLLYENAARFFRIG